MLRLIAPDTFASMATGQTHAWLARAVAAAAAAGVTCEAVSTASDQPHEAILHAAEAAGCDLVLMASHGRRDWRARMAGSVTHRVVDRAKVAVLIARVESNVVPDAQERALSAIRDDHRSLAAVLSAMQRHTGECIASGQTLNAQMIGAAIEYIEAFPERLHHPKEEQTLFARLRLRAPQSAPLLDALEGQHRDGAQIFRGLRQAQAAELPAFELALAAFARSQCQHMRTEESLVLPMASEYLHAEDWQEIAVAFEGRGDPRFDDGTEESLGQVFTRLMNLAAHGDTSSRMQAGSAAAAD